MPHHVVVDGSNLATEGRTQPSLAQLDQAVQAYMAEHPDSLITVVVDATFGHRIDPKEVSAFDEGVSNNELVAPPAGAIGRGDAFVLSIADKVHATVISNDSYQEFHGQYAWLFDEGRLVGGKPVPHIGWVFVNRLPVRGPLSRKSVADGKRKAAGGKATSPTTVRVGSPEANQPMPVPKGPPPGPATAKAKGRSAPVEKAATKRNAKAAPRARGDAADGDVKSTVNDLLSFLTFVERHPVGTSVNAIVDHYSSHGAYVRIDAVVGYVPLRLMADPPPRSAREFMKVGESVTLVVDSFRPAKRSVDLAIPGLGSAPAAVEAKAKPAKPAKAAKPVKKATTKPKKAPAKKPTAKAPKKSAPPAKTPTAKASVAKVAKAPAKAAAAKKSNGALSKLGLRRRRAPE
ncbi:MAG: S1 RNA-binding domain-containing protein [Ilumatobacteraceae bacterium]